MNILFLSLVDFESLETQNIYSDLLRKFLKEGNKIFAISPIERRKKKNTYIIKKRNHQILKLKIGNIQKINVVEKGISTMQIENQCIKAIKKYYSDVRFDLILYSTPPITFVKVIEFIKKRDHARS